MVEAVSESISIELNLYTCGFEHESYCEQCDTVLPHMCVEGLVQCPVCNTNQGICPGCTEEGMTDS